MRIILALAAAITMMTTPAVAQKGGFRSPTMSRPVTISRPTPSYSRPTPAYRAAPTVRVADPVAQARRPVTVPKTTAPRIGLPVPKREAETARQVRRDSAVRPLGRPVGRRYGYRGSSWAWTAPAVMPIWWMSTMNQPYSFDSYDDFIRRCLRTPPRQRSRECVRALRERGISA